MRKSYHILYCLMAVLAVSCIKPDPDEIDGECPTCPYEDEDGTAKGTVTVGYSLDDGELSTRGLPANERISSLKYLLYDSDGNIIRERNIPDINEHTVWPLRRDNMTWAQREALKDTLYRGVSYTAVFIANADSTLFEEGKELRVLHDRETLSGIFLSLPPVPFKDNNMFYLCVKDIGETMTAGQAAHLDCPVLLERIVSRTDIERVGMPDTYLESKVESSLYGSVEKTISSALKSSMGDFADRFAEAYIGTAGHLIFDLSMTSDETAGKILDEAKEQIVSFYVSYLEDNDAVLARMQPWENRSFDIVIDDVADRFNIADRSVSDSFGQPASVKYTADSRGVLSLFGFGDGTKNGLASLAFDDGTNIGFTSGQFLLWPGMNKMNSAICDPLSSVVAASGATTQDLRVTVAMRSILENLSGFNQDFVSALETAAEYLPDSTLDTFVFVIPLPLPDESGISASVTAA